MGRSAANEPLFRTINEAIRRGRWPGEPPGPAGFRCECARLGCTRIINVPIAEYERVREDPRRFVVATGHEQAEFETVVARGGGYVVVEKRGDAAELAEMTDPRV
jgi:hypothetical protein